MLGSTRWIYKYISFIYRRFRGVFLWKFIFSQDKNLYIYVGGAGGGATHIASASGLLSTLSSNTSAVLRVAGGGGGARDQINLEAASRHGDGGSGGGTSNGIRLGSGYARITFVSAN